MEAHDQHSFESQPTDLDRAGANVIRAARVDELPNGTLIGSYTIEGVLGRGAHGTVYRAADRGALRRTVALKVIEARGARDGIALALREARALERLVHPSIARVFDVGLSPVGTAYIAMELVEGLTLTQWCRTMRPTLHARIAVLLDVCAALQHAHERGIIHRDLKPSNILVADVNTKPRGMVIDFGIASLTHAAEHEVQASPSAAAFPSQSRAMTSLGGAAVGVGTIETMAPEQLIVGALADIRSDIYSIGAVLYWAIAGKAPFEREGSSPDDLARLVERIRTEPRPQLMPSSVAPDLRIERKVLRELNAILLRALEKEAGARYRSAAELADDLARLVRGEVPLAAQTNFTSRTRAFVRRHRVLVTSFSAICAVLLGAAFFTSESASRERRARVAAEESRVAADAARIEQEAAVEALRGALRAIVKDVRAVGNSSELMRHWPSVIDAFSKAYGPTHGLTMVQRYRYAEFLVTARRFDEAMVVLREMEAIALPERAHTILACVRFRLSQCMEGLGRKSEALAVIEQTLQDDYPSVKPCDMAAHQWSAIVLHGRLMCALGRHDEGFARLREGIEEQRRCFGGAGSLNDTQARGVLCEELLAAGRREEAAVELDTLLAQAYAGPSKDDMLLRVWIRRLETTRLCMRLDDASASPGHTPERRAQIARDLRDTAIDWMRYTGLDMTALEPTNRALERAGEAVLTREAVEAAILRLTEFGNAPPSL